MKKTTGLFGAALLAGGILAGCSADSENPTPEENSTSTETSTENAATETEQTGGTAEQEVQEGAQEAEKAAENAEQEASEAADAVGKAIEEEVQQVPENAEEIKEQVELPAENYEAGEDGTVGSSSSSSPETTTETAAEGTEAAGTFNGLVDPHTVELQVDGQATSYQVDPESDMMKQFEAMTEGDSVTFTYVEEGAQLVITELK